VLREFVVKLLGTEEGADEVLRRAWVRLEGMEKLPLGTDSKTMLFTLAEREVQGMRQNGPEPAPMSDTKGRGGNSPDASRRVGQ